MHEPKEQRIDVPANSIPIEKDDVTSQYNSDTRELSVRSQLSAEQLLAIEYQGFTASVQLSLATANNPRLLDVLKGYLPQRLKDACVIFYYQTSEAMGAIALQPSRTIECLSIFKNALQNDASLSADDAAMLRKTIRTLYRLNNQANLALPTDQNMVNKMAKVQEAAWSEFHHYLHDPEEYRKSLLRRDHIHERKHHVTMDVKWDGAVIQMVQLEGVIHDLTLTTLGEPYKDAVRLSKQIGIIRSLIESEAYIHESLGAQILEEPENYVHSELCSRLLDLMSYFQMNSQTNTLQVDTLLHLDEMEPGGKLDFRYHAVGTILLLLGPAIYRDKLTKSLSLLSRKRSDTVLIEQLILDKSVELVTDQAAAAAHMRQAYDSIQEMMKAIGITFTRELVRFVSTYPDVFAGLGWDDVKTIQTYLNFLSEHPQVFMNEPLRIHRHEKVAPPALPSPPEEVPSERRVQRVFSLARRMFSQVRSHWSTT